MIELVIVIAIAAILMALAAYSFRDLRRRVRRTSCRENMRVIHKAAILAQTEQAELDNTNLTIGKLLSLGYLRRKYTCPSGGSYAITQEQEHVRITCFKTNDSTDHEFVE